MPKLWPSYSDECIAACTQLISEGRTYYSSSDPEVDSFESAFQARFTKHSYTVFANSATSIAYAVYRHLAHAQQPKKALNMVVPAHTYRASVLPLLPLGITPVFYGQQRFGEVDVNSIADLVDKDTIGVLVTHLFGLAVDMGPLYSAANDLCLPVIEDCSHAHGVSVNGSSIGNGAFAAFYSTGTKKLVSGGMGGVLCTSDQKLHDDVLATTQPPSRAKQKSIEPGADFYGRGFNMRGNPISARLAVDHVHRFDQIITAKNLCLSIVGNAIEASRHITAISPLRPQDGTLYNLPFYINAKHDHVMGKFVDAGLRVKKYQECLTDHKVFRDCRKGAEYRHKNVYYFDTRDLYGDSDMATHYARIIEECQ